MLDFQPYERDVLIVNLEFDIENGIDSEYVVSDSWDLEWMENNHFVECLESFVNDTQYPKWIREFFYVPEDENGELMKPYLVEIIKIENGKAERVFKRRF